MDIRLPLQLRDSAGLLVRVTGFAIEPSHPGERRLNRYQLKRYGLCKDRYILAAKGQNNK